MIGIMIEAMAGACLIPLVGGMIVALGMLIGIRIEITGVMALLMLVVMDTVADIKYFICDPLYY